MKLLKNDLANEDQRLKARAIAINAYMQEHGKGWFSIADLRRLYQNDTDMKKEIFLLSHHGFVKEKIEKDITYFTINLLVADRLLQIEANLVTSTNLVQKYKAELNSLKKQLDNWTKLKEQCEKLPDIIKK